MKTVISGIFIDRANKAMLTEYYGGKNLRCLIGNHKKEVKNLESESSVRKTSKYLKQWDYYLNKQLVRCIAHLPITIMFCH